jgi:hypothetical protein
LKAASAKYSATTATSAAPANLITCLSVAPNKRATRTVEQGFLFGVGTFVPHCTHPLTGGEIKDSGGCSFLSLALAKPLTIQATINAAKKTAKHGAKEQPDGPRIESKKNRP